MIVVLYGLGAYILGFIVGWVWCNVYSETALWRKRKHA